MDMDSVPPSRPTNPEPPPAPLLQPSSPAPYAGPVAPVVNHIAPAAAVVDMQLMAIGAPVVYGGAVGHGAAIDMELVLGYGVWEWDTELELVWEWIRSWHGVWALVWDMELVSVLCIKIRHINV
ncbi:hypothetical protein CEXT_148411 [Caerostris extrusa]|uniref:Uncharacterized protein n=1 Tax=Caerostris extrusa TaxID=172846 RepID=A0AAV4V8V8_CAEEX|nr:hypothetical protein CEXT_148411 [Caerostris extrusa]